MWACCVAPRICCGSSSLRRRRRRSGVAAHRRFVTLLISKTLPRSRCAVGPHSDMYISHTALLLGPTHPDVHGRYAPAQRCLKKAVDAGVAATEVAAARAAKTALEEENARAEERRKAKEEARRAAEANAERARAAALAARAEEERRQMEREAAEREEERRQMEREAAERRLARLARAISALEAAVASRVAADIRRCMRTYVEECTSRRQARAARQLPPNVVVVEEEEEEERALISRADDVMEELRVEAVRQEAVRREWKREAAEREAAERVAAERAAAESAAAELERAAAERAAAERRAAERARREQEEALERELAQQAEAARREQEEALERELAQRAEAARAARDAADERRRVDEVTESLLPSWKRMLDRSRNRGSVLEVGLAELTACTGGFAATRKVGEGGFGDVFATQEQLPSLAHLGVGRVAIKRLREGGGQGMRELAAEIEVLSKCTHAHLLSLLAVCYDDTSPALIYPLVCPRWRSSMACHSLRA